MCTFNNEIFLYEENLSLNGIKSLIELSYDYNVIINDYMAIMNA